MDENNEDKIIDYEEIEDSKCEFCVCNGFHDENGLGKFNILKF